MERGGKRNIRVTPDHSLLNNPYQLRKVTTDKTIMNYN